MIRKKAIESPSGVLYNKRKYMVVQLKLAGGNTVEHYVEILKQFGVAMTVAGAIIGIILSFVVFFGFMPKKYENRFHGIFGWLYDYLNFKNFIIESLLKFFYVLGACVCTMVGIFNILCLQLVTGFGVLIFGNLILRILYEFVLMMVLICRNVTEINKKLGGGVGDNVLFKECELPPIPKKGDFMMKPAPEKESPMQETAATSMPPSEMPTDSDKGMDVKEQAKEAAPQKEVVVDEEAIISLAEAALNTCSKCGHVSEGGAAFCIKCGNKLA